MAILGIPTIAMAQNEQEAKNGFVCAENGFSYIGLKPSDSEIEGQLKLYLEMDKKQREKKQKALLSHNLRDGRKRVMALINNL